MLTETFLQTIERGAVEGSTALAREVEALLGARYPAESLPLATGGARIQLEPLLIAHLAEREPSLPIEHVLAGYRPSSRSLPEVDVVADEAGVVYIPEAGYYSTGLPRARLRLKSDERNRGATFMGAMGAVHARFEERLLVADGRIELYRRSPLPFRNLYTTEDGRTAEVDASSLVEQAAAPLHDVFAILRKHHPRLHETLCRVLRGIIAFRNADVNSFAAVAAHGVAFLNVTDSLTVPFLLEDLAHQGGHVLFTVTTLHPERLLMIPAETPLSALNGRTQDTRSVYEALHGVLTEALIVECLAAWLDRGADESVRREIEGRLGFILRRNGYDLRNLCHDGIFTQKGQELFSQLLQSFRAAYTAYGCLADAQDFSNQGYTFSYSRFRAANQIAA